MTVLPILKTFGELEGCSKYRTGRFGGGGGGGKEKNSFCLKSDCW